MNVLIVEDETRVADFIRRGMKAEGWFAEHAPSGEAGLARLAEQSFDVVILDVMLPGVSGRDVCRAMRARGDLTPVLMLTALDGVDERVEGLKLGADDYLAKPFDFEELVARLHALHRRAVDFRSEPQDAPLIFRGVTLDRRSLILRVDGEEREVSAKERDLLLLFLSNQGVVLSRERILGSVWNVNEDPMTNVVDVYVGRLRRKIGAYGACIKTVRGAGYRLG